MKFLRWWLWAFGLGKKPSQVPEKTAKVVDDSEPLPILVDTPDPVAALGVNLTFRTAGQVYIQSVDEGIMIEIANAADTRNNGGYFVPFKGTDPARLLRMKLVEFRERFKDDGKG